ncbi:MAG: hypothetical protein R3E95_14320 [Thiolinea sp.]
MSRLFCYPLRSAVLGLLLCRPVLADTPDSLLAGYQEQAQAEDSNFSGFEAAREETAVSEYPCQ